MFEPAIDLAPGPQAPVAPGTGDHRDSATTVEFLGPLSGSAREPVEAFIEAAYRRAFSGRPCHHFPILVSLRAANGELQAAAGIRRASQEPLFLEQYLDLPIEFIVSQRAGATIGRHAILEIGSLASSSPKASTEHFKAIAKFSANEGCSIAVATMTRQLRRKFARFQIPLFVLAPADPERLGAGAAQWGGYYHRDPQVVAGPLGTATAKLVACESSRSTQSA